MGDFDTRIYFEITYSALLHEKINQEGMFLDNFLLLPYQ